MNAIFTRRSIRSFLSKEVEQEKIEKLLKAAMQAPSAGNQQAWEFLVVRGKENLEKLSKFSPYASSLASAAVGIVVLWAKGNMRFPENWEQDLGACTQNILLEACELSLGGVWYGVAPVTDRMDYISELYNLNSNQVPYSVVGIGYPKEENANRFINRYDASKVTYID